MNVVGEIQQSKRHDTQYIYIRYEPERPHMTYKLIDRFVSYELMIEAPRQQCECCDAFCKIVSEPLSPNFKEFAQGGGEHVRHLCYTMTKKAEKKLKPDIGEGVGLCMNKD